MPVSKALPELPFKSLAKLLNKPSTMLSLKELNVLITFLWLMHSTKVLLIYLISNLLDYLLRCKVGYMGYQMIYHLDVNFTIHLNHHVHDN